MGKHTRPRKPKHYDTHINGLVMNQDRFWSNVDKITDPNGCWIWTRFIHPKTGLGMMGVEVDGKKKMDYVQRISYRLHHGHPGGLDVVHTCGRAACVNPQHLELMTRSDASKRKAGKKNRVKEPPQPSWSQKTLGGSILDVLGGLLDVKITKK